MKLGLFRKYVATPILLLVFFSVSVISFVLSAGDVAPTVGPIYKADDNGKVSLMVNVYWGEQYLPEMLNVFASKEVKTTFFVGGTWAEKNLDTLRSIYSAGHEIANHGFFHKDHKKLSYERNREEIVSTHNLIKSTLGVEMKLFSPPSASFSDITLKVVSDFGYTMIVYSKDTIDWRDQDTALIFKRATKNISGGDLVLMHPTAATVSILPAIIDEIKQKGLILTTVSDIIENKNY